MYKIKYKEYFFQKAVVFFKKNPSLKESYKSIITILEQNPFEKSLILQNLYKDLRELYFIDITIEFRIILYIDFDDKLIYLIDIGKMKKE